LARLRLLVDFPIWVDRKRIGQLSRLTYYKALLAERWLRMKYNIPNLETAWETSRQFDVVSGLGVVALHGLSIAIHVSLAE
jgi:hypothetical protein